MCRARDRVVALRSFQWQERGHWRRQSPTVRDDCGRRYRKNTLEKYNSTLAYSAVPVITEIILV